MRSFYARLLPDFTLTPGSYAAVASVQCPVGETAEECPSFWPRSIHSRPWVCRWALPPGQRWQEGTRSVGHC